MKKILLIALREYERQVARKAFIGVLLFPLFIIAIAIVVGLISASSTINSDRGVVGYVDPANALARAAHPPGNADNTFQRFDTVEAAQAALEQKRIIAYYALAPDFTATRQADLRYWQNEPGNRVRRAFEAFARSALLADALPAVRARLIEGATFTQTTLDGSRTFDENNIMSFVLPFIAAILFIIALFSGASYLLQAMVDEKENRTIEIVVSSVTPMQLMSGKVIGLAGVGLTQILVWLIGASAAVFLLRDRLEFLQGVNVDAGFVALAFVLFVLQYLIYGAIMAGIGSIVVDARQGQSYSTPFTLAAMIPWFFLTAILFDPNGTVAVVLSLFPLSAPLTLLVRYSMTSIPAWQLVVAIGFMILTAIGALWLAARIFRIGMLRFGQRVNLSEIAASIRF